MTLIELKDAVDALIKSQPLELETNIKELRVVDNGDWRHVEALLTTDETRKILDNAIESFGRMRDSVEQMIIKNRDERLKREEKQTAFKF